MDFKDCDLHGNWEAEGPHTHFVLSLLPEQSHKLAQFEVMLLCTLHVPI
jgi:hypothetical protein